MECRHCGAKCKVLNSRSSEDAKNAKRIPEKFKCTPRPYIYRDHKCTECGKTQQSVEISSDSLCDMQDQIAKQLKSDIIRSIYEYDYRESINKRKELSDEK